MPKAFKKNPSNFDLLFLHVTQLFTDEFGLEFFVELCNSFGWTPSEWGWQACLALVSWRLLQSHVTDIYCFVDNFWHIHPPGSDAGQRAATAAASFKEMQLDMHEAGFGTRCDKCLGWIVDLDLKDHPLGWTMVMICPEDKYLYYLPLFKRWAVASALTVKELSRAAGILQWLSAGLPTVRAYVAPIVALRILAENRAHRLSNNRRFNLNVAQDVTEAAREALSVVAQIVSRWDRICPIVGDFGPHASAECEGWVDAATHEDHGCGGIFWIPSKRQLLGFAHVWTPEERKIAMCQQRVSTGVLEALGMAHWMRRFAQFCTCRRTLLRTDNEAVMMAYRSAFSPKLYMLTNLRDVRLLAAEHHMMLRVRQVKGSVFNQIADFLSHDNKDAARRLAWETFGVRLTLL